MITGLHHVNLRAPAELLVVLRDFYRDAIGLELGPRPDFGTHGYWLYAGGHPVLHLPEQLAHEPRRGAVDPAAPTTFDHTAYAGTNPTETAARLHALDVPFRESRSAQSRQHQFFLKDPAGNGVEINFPF
jgi:catechol 2,3-dioxygenase-like lactoylglutathione lyase family enzyme